MAVRVIVVDDQPIVLAGFAAIIDAEEGLEVVGTAADGEAAVRLAAELRPDVVVMDIRMPGMDGLTATRLVTSAEPPAKVLVLTTFDLDAYVFEALRAGASGFLLKDADPDELIAAIRVIAAGEALLDPAVTGRLIAAFAAGDSAPAAEPAVELSALTPRERDVLILIAEGLSNAEIAERLGVGVGTVKTHVNGLLAKLGVRDRVQATILAYDVGLVRPRR